MNPRLLTLLLVAFAPLLAHAADDPAAIKKLSRPGFRVVTAGGALVELHTLGAGDADLAGLDQFKSLRVLSLSNSSVTDAALKKLAGFDSLEVLDLFNSRKITGAGLKTIAGLKRLKRLQVEIWQLNDDAVLALGAAGKLHTLNLQVDLRGAPATDRDVRHLNIGGRGVTDASLKALTGLTSLEALYLFGPNITDKGMKDLAALPTLKLLSMRGAGITDAGLAAIAGLKSLDTLHIDGAPISDAGMKTIAGFKSLHTLFINSPAVSPDGIRQLAGLPLHDLILGRATTDAHLQALSDVHLLHALSEARNARGDRPRDDGDVYMLDLQRYPISGAALKALKPLRALQILRLEGTRVTGKDLLELAPLPSLGAVRVDNGVITDDTLRLLREHNLLHILASEARLGAPSKTLPWLNLQDKPITDAGLKQLAGIPSLERLYLGNTRITDDGLDVLKTLPALRELRLDNTQVTDDGLKILAKIPTLRDLYLDKARITSAGLLAFAGHKSLRLINLTPQQVNDETLRFLGVNRMLHLLSAARTSAGERPRSEDDITALILNQSAVSDDGLRELAGLKSLQLLMLRGTKTTDEAVEALKKDLPRLKTVSRR
ncbi:MAG: hypothetical protein U0793_00310 [Gemmataceae bacterium]